LVSVILDDATSQIYYAQLVEEESTVMFLPAAGKFACETRTIVGRTAARSAPSIGARNGGAGPAPELEAAL